MKAVSSGHRLRGFPESGQFWRGRARDQAGPSGHWTCHATRSRDSGVSHISIQMPDRSLLDRTIELTVTDPSGVESGIPIRISSFEFRLTEPRDRDPRAELVTSYATSSQKSWRCKIEDGRVFPRAATGSLTRFQINIPCGYGQNIISICSTEGCRE